MPRLVLVIRGTPKISPFCLKLNRTEMVIFSCAKLGGIQHARNAACSSRTLLMRLFDGWARVIASTIETQLTRVATRMAEARAMAEKNAVTLYGKSHGADNFDTFCR